MPVTDPCDRDDTGDDYRCAACLERAVDAAEALRNAYQEDGIDWRTML